MLTSFLRFRFSLRIVGFLVVSTMFAIPEYVVFAQSQKTSDNTDDVVQKAIAQFERNPLQTIPLGNGIYMFSGDGGNVVAVTDSSSTLLIDSGIGSRAAELQTAVYQATHRPITRLVDTHWHFDHAGGNTLFGSTGVTIIAQENVKTRMSSAQNVPFINLHDGPYPSQALPSVTYVDNMQLKQGREQVRLLHTGEAHTDGDTVVFVEPANVVILSDIFSEPFYPVIDLTSGGSLQGIIDCIDQVLSVTNEETRYVPGHGPVATRAELQAYRNMLSTVQERVTGMVRAGDTMDQVVAADPAKDFDSKWGTGYVDGKVFIEMAYTSIARH